MLLFSPGFSGPNPCGTGCSNCDEECNQVGCDPAVCQTCLDQPAPTGCSGVIPIDGGLIWLILGGAGLGAKSLLDKRKKARSAES